MNQRELILLIVAFHPSVEEVEQLLSSLDGLSSRIGYAVVVNDHCPGEAVEQLAAGADVPVSDADGDTSLAGASYREHDFIV